MLERENYSEIIMGYNEGGRGRGRGRNKTILGKVRVTKRLGFFN